MTIQHINRTYGVGTIRITEVKEQIENVGGELVVKVVHLDPEANDDKLALALFYKNPEGEYFDVIQTNDGKLKRMVDAGRLAGTIARLGFIENISIPMMLEQNLIEMGSLR